jgi:hypothetical protein
MNAWTNAAVFFVCLSYVLSIVFVAWALLQLYRAARGPRRNRRHTLPPPTKDARSSIDEHWRIVGRG